MSKLVIVESPAKAKTISRFLGKDYDVQASFGHVRDLPEKADEVPADMKKQKWAKLGVNVDGDFEPLYVVPDDKKRHVDNLKRAAKDATELLLATDEDREGESISWHILELLKLKKGIPVSRIVFHEITPEAIREALDNPRKVDLNLVRAQETRRILDRLYGYSLSPVLWKKVAPKLSAGRVQSVAVRLTVERERERMRFVASTYWDLLANLGVTEGAFDARLNSVDGVRVATGRSFDPESGQLKDKSVLLDAARAAALEAEARVANGWKVLSIETTPGKEKAPPPFMTSTLQQEGNRKLRFSSKRTMQIAQQLYEGVDMGGERVGLITYMRTDSLNLAERAVREARDVIGDLYGAEYLPAKPNVYRTKAKGAQEAHEAIRPTDLSRRPQDVQRFLDKDQFALYELIWKRTIACQMVDARVNRTSVEVGVTVPSGSLSFGASGKQITFPGFLRAYVEGSDDPEAALEDKETVLPPLKQGQSLDLNSLEAQSHTTKPPARYTEASLVKKLEEEGVGRPSTYASIISTIQDRGYVNKRGNELVPTFTAFAVTELLETHFKDLVDLAFTAKMENELDDIAEGKQDSVEHLRRFYNGSPQSLIPQIESQVESIQYPAIQLGADENGEPVVVRVGRYGTFIQRGEASRANVPDDLAPAELTLEKALELLARQAAGPEAIAQDADSGRNIYLRKGRFGDYLELEQTEEEKATGDKPQRVTLPAEFKGTTPSTEDAALLMKLPRNVGIHPDLGTPITATIGKFGPFVKCGDEFRNVPDWRTAATLSLADAVALLAAPKTGRGGRIIGAPAAAKEPLKNFGKLEGAQGDVRVLEGRFGPYVTDGKTNATLPKSDSPDEITAERALELLLAKAAAGPSKKPFKRGGRTAAKR
jgi:DNA topoisomerase-1